jgi:hypothetical protein
MVTYCFDFFWQLLKSKHGESLRRAATYYRKNRCSVPPNVIQSRGVFVPEIRGGTGQWSLAAVVILVKNGYSRSIRRPQKYGKQY